MHRIRSEYTSMQIGAMSRPEGGVSFSVWAPHAERVTLELEAPGRRSVSMQPAGGGVWHAEVRDAGPGARYRYRLDDTEPLPDPVSRYQPEGVHGPSEVVGLLAAPDDAGNRYRGVPLDELVLYELHLGTFTPEGTAEAAIARLDDLVKLGVTAIEIMPVAAFPGERNWGYDGVGLFAVHRAYGGPQGLRKLVAAAHARGLSVFLDVVYNHLGPEGNYLARFGPYFTARYVTPWGEAVNFDGPGSDHVREFFIQNALYWLEVLGFDGLRLDAVEQIYDMSAYPFLSELSDRVAELSERSGRRRYLIAESDLNDARMISPRELHGHAMDAQWCDDFHHAVHAMLTGEREEYYRDFGSLRDLAKAFEDGFVYTGQYSPYRKRRFGNSTAGLSSKRFVVCVQNHDQVGNRMLGERFTQLLSAPQRRLAAATMLFSPFVPMLFMGEEYAEEAPFQYFVHHSDPQLIKAVREGRAQEFAEFHDQGQAPDPQHEDTFRRSRLNWDLREQRGHRELLAFYRDALALRRAHPALGTTARDSTALRTQLRAGESVLMVERGSSRAGVLLLFNYCEEARSVSLPPADTGFVVLLASDDPRYADADAAAHRSKAGAAAAPAGATERAKAGDRLSGGERLTLGPWSALVLETAPETENEPGQATAKER